MTTTTNSNLSKPKQEANQGDTGSRQHYDKDQLPPHTDRDTADINVEGHPIKTYNQYIPQPLIQSERYNSPTITTKTKLLRLGSAQRLPTSSTPLYPEQPALEIQRYLLFSLTKFIIWRVLETIAIRANNKPYNTSTDRSRVTDEARPDWGSNSKTSLPAIQTCQPLQEEENTMKINSLQAGTQVTDIKEPT